MKNGSKILIAILTLLSAGNIAKANDLALKAGIINKEQHGFYSRGFELGFNLDSENLNSEFIGKYLGNKEDLNTIGEEQLSNLELKANGKFIFDKEKNGYVVGNISYLTGKDVTLDNVFETMFGPAYQQQTKDFNTFLLNLFANYQAGNTEFKLGIAEGNSNKDVRNYLKLGNNMNENYFKEISNSLNLNGGVKYLNKILPLGVTIGYNLNSIENIINNEKYLDSHNQYSLEMDLSKKLGNIDLGVSGKRIWDDVLGDKYEFRAIGGYDFGGAKAIVYGVYDTNKDYLVGLHLESADQNSEIGYNDVLNEVKSKITSKDNIVKNALKNPRSPNTRLSASYGEQNGQKYHGLEAEIKNFYRGLGAFLGYGKNGNDWTAKAGISYTPPKILKTPKTPIKSTPLNDELYEGGNKK